MLNLKLDIYVMCVTFFTKIKTKKYKNDSLFVMYFDNVQYFGAEF